jgi:cation transport regulator ChaC
MLKYLTKREACQPRSLAIRLQDGGDVAVFVYIYEGKNILDPTTPLAEMASMVVRAKGKSGACVDYVRLTFGCVLSTHVSSWPQQEATRTHGPTLPSV